MYKFSVVIIGFMLLAFSYETHAVNFAVFHKVDKNMTFQDVVQGGHGAFIVNMERQGAEMLALTNIPHAMHNDVITLQTSALHDNAGELGDFGLDCHLSYKNESTDNEISHTLAGLCKIIRVGRGQDSRKVILIQQQNIADSDYAKKVWVKLAEDKEAGIAFYATVR